VPELMAGNRVFLDSAGVTWEELASRAMERGLGGGSASRIPRVAIIARDNAAAFEAVAVMARDRLDAVLLGYDRFSEGIRTLLVGSGYEVIEYPGSSTIAASGERVSNTMGRVGLLTSGTTGNPKLIRHTWETLFTVERATSHERRCWLIPYQVGTYAWFQLVTMGLFVAGQDLVPLKSEVSGAAFVETVFEYGVDCVSSTPTLWRLAFLEVPIQRLEEMQLRQITLGGEIIDQALLDRLRNLFPKTRISQVYASSEAGACIVVQDGKAGFPARMLDATSANAVQLKIQDGRLWVRSRKSMAAALGNNLQWIDTGDRVEQIGDRVFFLGRVEEGVINVGGTKLRAREIEEVILQHPSVLWCRVHPLRAPLVGNLPEADFVVTPKCLPPSDTELMAHCRGRLPEEGIPRFWNRLDSIPIQPSLKAKL